MAFQGNTEQRPHGQEFEAALREDEIQDFDDKVCEIRMSLLRTLQHKLDLNEASDSVIGMVALTDMLGFFIAAMTTDNKGVRPVTLEHFISYLKSVVERYANVGFDKGAGLH